MKNSRFESKAKEIIYQMSTCLAIMAVAYFMVRCNRHTDFGYFNIADYAFVYRDIPIMLLSSLFGLIPAVIAFLFALVDAMIYDIRESYEVSAYLIATIVSFMICRNGRYKKPSSAILAGVLLTGQLGGVWYLVNMAASAEGFGALTWEGFLLNLCMVVPEVFFYITCMCVFYHFAPDKAKRVFVMGVLYTADEDAGIREIRERMNSPLSRRLSMIIFMEAAALGVAASIFAAQLMPSVADKVLSGRATDQVAFYDFSSQVRRYHSDLEEDQEQQTEDAQSDNSQITGEDTGTDEQFSEEAMRHVQFLMNNAGIAFMLRMILMIFNVSIPFVVLADTYMQLRIARPITAMANTVKDFSAATREEQTKKLLEMERLKVRGNDEIAILYDNIAQMATEINEFVDQTLREQKLEEDLRVAKIASENKSDFLNNVSHELRTPINAVLGLDEMILRESHEEEIRNYAADIQNSGKTLLALVNDILDSSKLEAGKMEILPVEYELGSLINDAINMIVVRAKEKGLQLDIHVDSHLPHILYGDEIRIKQIMVNILTNAVKYTEEGSVDFALGFQKADEENIYLECSVKDTGIGIKPEDMDKLFGRFERIDEGKNRTIEGTGLGMSIVTQLLDLMGSKLEVESVYGSGSVFSFRVLQKVVNWDEMGDYEESYRKSLRHEEYRECFVAPDARILVTDDTPMNLTVIKALLKSTKVQIDTAESGFETLDRIKEKKYDVIFLDHRMPQMDGIETLKRMGETEGNLNTDTPVIALTANAVSGAREVYINAGFKDYLSKPIDSIKLENMLVEYLPEEKVTKTACEWLNNGDESLPDETSDRLTLLRKEAGLDVDEAIKNCGGSEAFLSVIDDYYRAIPEKSEAIENYWNEKDYKNYTVLVHALKSSSRLIGATELSKEAAHLEEMGNKASENDENAINEIDLKTPVVLKSYRTCAERLAPFFESTDEDDTRELIDDAMLSDALSALKELVDAVDFDSADLVMEQIRNYRMPEDVAEDMKRIERLLASVDQAELLKTLDEIMTRKGFV
ncbi:MAG: response regulator [Lachnospiraceae bacterium]|nr:response regulator [Lachnospiraceae bacterium]